MDYDSTDILLERQTSDFYNYICNQNASKFTVQFAVLLYFISTFLSIFIDTSPYYDIIGLCAVFILICAQIPFTGRNIRTVIHILVILLWSFVQITLAVVYWKLEDRRFPSYYHEGKYIPKVYRLLMFIGQGFQLTLVLWLTIVMIRTSRHSKFNWVLRKRTTLITITGWLLALVGLNFSTVYARQLKFKDEFEWNWHYGGQMMMWLGLNLSALTSFPITRTSHNLLAFGPLCYAIPCLVFSK